MNDLTRKTILDLIAGRISVLHIWKGSSNRIDLDCVEFEGNPDDPLALALIDYLVTKNFASLAVVLDEEAAKIDTEMDRPITDDDLRSIGGFEPATWDNGIDYLLRERTIAGIKIVNNREGWVFKGTSKKVTRRILAALFH